MADKAVTNSQKLRNARACEACRASKSRCVYKHQQGVCQRCEQSGNECVVRSKARPMRTRAARPANAVKNETSPDEEAEFGIDLPTISVPNSSRDVAELHEHHKHYFGDDSSLDSANSAQSSSTSLVPQRRITRPEAERLLLSFRDKAPFFPFVLIPAEATIQSLSKASPFLLLAILTTAALKDPPLHHQLDHEFRRILSSKVIVEGRKSLDFLQGLLVYISWYPIHSRPKNNQSFMYMNLAISLTVDLGLDRETPVVNNFNAINTQGLADNGVFTKAAKRAYLGCYFLSSVISMGFQKSNNLQYRNLMDAHGESLLQNEVSNEISSLVKLQRLAERIAELHTTKQPVYDPHMNSLTAEMNVQIFLNEVQEWRRVTPDEIKSLPFIGLAERFVGLTIYSHELGFLRRPYRDHLLQSESITPANQSHLSSCLEACKKYFEYLISIPESSYLNFTTVQWSCMVQSILVLSRLTFLMAANLGWDVNTTRANVPLVMYLDCLCYRFQTLSSTIPDGSDPPKNPDVLYVFKMVLGSVKKSYERRVSNIKPDFFIVDHGTAIGVARGHCPMLDPTLSVYFNNPLSEDSTYTGSFDLDGSASYPSSEIWRPANMPLYHDLWATMTCSWAEEI